MKSGNYLLGAKSVSRSAGKFCLYTKKKKIRFQFIICIQTKLTLCIYTLAEPFVICESIEEGNPESFVWLMTAPTGAEIIKTIVIFLLNT